MKKYIAKIQRTYTTYVEVEANSKQEVEDRITDPSDDEFWDKFLREELEQYNVDHEQWEIKEAVEAKS